MLHRRSTIVPTTLCVFALGAPAALAGTQAESGDTGSLPASAQAASGVGALDAIAGDAVGDQDVDLYKICIASPSTFSALTSGGVIDPQLFLFDGAGMGVEANDDIVAGVDRRAHLTAGNANSPTSSGVHYLALSRWDNDALSTGGRIFPNTQASWGQVNGPTGPGGALPLSGWSGQGDAANENGPTDYVVSLQGAAHCISFEGFGAPIDNGVVNAARAGQTIPVKYRLTDSAGTPVEDPASFVSVSSQSSGGECAGLPSDSIETYSGDSGLQYAGDGQWQFNFKTPKSYAGQCRTMTLTLADGTSHSARFEFK
jgi:hypothetical protein